jgi:hypothetical protein
VFKEKWKGYTLYAGETPRRIFGYGSLDDKTTRLL